MTFSFCGGVYCAASAVTIIKSTLASVKHSGAAHGLPKAFILPGVSATLSMQRLSAGSVGRSSQRAGGAYPLAKFRI